MPLLELSPLSKTVCS